MKDARKFYLKCALCSGEIPSFTEWFHADQRCPECGSNRADVVYTAPIEKIKSLIGPNHREPKGLWHYFDFLPLNDRANIITGDEGIVPIDRWTFLEDYARRRNGIDCRIYAHRHDDNYPTGTFKDLSGSVVGSVLKEIGIENYVVASTGNIAVSYSRYLTAAGLNLYAFIPQNSSSAQEAEIGCFGQRVFRVAGDYTRAKELALEFARKYHFPLAAGNFDPMRIEAKKTMLLEWLRKMDEFPTVYIQALSGGTGPLAIAKGCRELEPLGLFKEMPRLILVQSDKCSPMADAWEEARSKNFPEGWEKTYPIYHNPDTLIPTLSTGYPKAYPVLAPLVRESGGEIISFDEEAVANLAQLIACERSVRMGPAAAIVIGGFVKSLRDGYLKDGDVILLNIGEGIRRSPAFMEQMITKTKKVKSLDDCPLFDRKRYRDELWNNLEK
ncbi:MAG: pyridoxal-phosphate dependent enzyme [Acidobacteria bacterium]|nr:pyridoxal-phosphate dependent enzyme [Acidobacteriota bacterium]MCG2815960.1 pyridoxal-phosphate dependent enzyme [Candidatus Aminicenantes bacterium]MBU1337768.1 pyridoxal-phosphate dependent enzyme [Acidobacteriota bacterium]MBU1473803.1 pyridoxal-phosphate dependent enzyme [Acidobacteriota bacterium]MBU4254920.1 pyridoxal-phosphate dependent enzyme [Acidobacteriota bacterium]